MSKGEPPVFLPFFTAKAPESTMAVLASYLNLPLLWALRCKLELAVAAELP